MIIQHNPQQYSIEGAVDFSTVPDLMHQAQRYLVASTADVRDPLVFDFSTIAACDSAALALILELVKQGKRLQLKIQFENIPASLLAIAKTYGIETEIRDFFK